MARRFLVIKSDTLANRYAHGIAVRIGMQAFFRFANPFSLPDFRGFKGFPAYKAMQHISHSEPLFFKRSRGGRISSPEFRQSLEACEDFSGLEDNVNRYDLLLLVKRAGKVCGFLPRMIELLDYYMSFTREIDWEEGGQPIVYQSLSKTALDLGVSERQIQKLENALFKAGAITWQDSGNHRRYGQRCLDTGMILYAYGVDLSPLASLRPVLEEKLAEKKLYDAAWLEAKRQISWYRRQVRGLLAELQETGCEDSARHGLEDAYNAIAVQIRTHMDLSRLHELRDKHKNLYQSALKAVQEAKPGGHIGDEKWEKTHKSSSKSERTFAHYKTTNHKQSDKSDTGSPTAIGFQESSNRTLAPSKGMIQQTEKPPEAEEGENPVLKTGLQHITLKQALNASSSRFREYLPIEPRPLNWHDFVETAYRLKAELQISQQSWANACVTLGRNGAAICLLLTDHAALREENRVLKPAAYFNAMIARAKKGELHLHNSIFAILKREPQMDG